MLIEKNICIDNLYKKYDISKYSIKKVLIMMTYLMKF